MEKRYLGIKEMSEYMGIQAGTLRVWCCYKKIPYLKIGRLIKFDLREIEVWLKDKKVKEIC